MSSIRKFTKGQNVTIYSENKKSRIKAKICGATRKDGNKHLRYLVQKSAAGTRHYVRSELIHEA